MAIATGWSRTTTSSSAILASASAPAGCSVGLGGAGLDPDGLDLDGLDLVDVGPVGIGPPSPSPDVQAPTSRPRASRHAASRHPMELDDGPRLVRSVRERGMPSGYRPVAPSFDDERARDGQQQGE